MSRLGGSGIDFCAVVRHIDQARSLLGEAVEYCRFDLEQQTYPEIGFDAIFLIRPPHLTSPRIFERYLRTLDPATTIVFLSARGADRRPYLPHTKIERVITRLGLRHVFIRPCYFMENLTTTLWKELKANNRIYLPSGNLKFQWIAVNDNAEIACKALTENTGYDAIDVCSSETYGFGEVVDKINTLCATRFDYVSPSVFEYLVYNIKNNERLSYTLVMLLLHYLPRFSNAAVAPSSDVARELQRNPTHLDAFISDNCENFRSISNSRKPD